MHTKTVNKLMRCCFDDILVKKRSVTLPLNTSSEGYSDIRGWG